MLTRILEKLTALDAIDRTMKQAIAAEPERPVFAVLRDAFELHTKILPADRARIPRTGPVIFVSNHPSGFSDGLVVHAVIDATRGDMKAMAHHWFGRWPALARRMFLVDPQRADIRNAAAMKQAVRWVRGGNSLCIEPAGEVAHGRFGSFEAVEKPWLPGLAALVRLTGATVVPVHAEATNRRRFHVLSWLHPRLGALLLLREILAQRGHSVRIRVGQPLTAADLKEADSPEAFTERCREAVLALGRRSDALDSTHRDHESPISGGVEASNAVYS